MYWYASSCVPTALICSHTWTHLCKFPATLPCRNMLVQRWLSAVDTSKYSDFITENNRLFAGLCTQLDNFTANQLASLMRCDLPGNSSLSQGLWKLLLMHLSSILDPTLNILANVVSGSLSLSSNIWKKSKAIVKCNYVLNLAFPVVHWDDGTSSAGDSGCDQGAQVVAADRRAADGQPDNPAVVLGSSVGLPAVCIRKVPALSGQQEPHLSIIRADVSVCQSTVVHKCY